MSRQEKRRKFNEAVVNMLYPPPPPPQPKDEVLAVNNSDQVLEADLVSDDFGESSSSTSSDGGESESQKRTRAQRKRLRRKKLKTDASRRGQIIGPLLPLTNDDNDHDNDKTPPTVRRNAAEKLPPMKPDEPVSSSREPRPWVKNKSKVKQRRIAKKLARKNLSAPSDESCDRDESVKSSRGKNSSLS